MKIKLNKAKLKYFLFKNGLRVEDLASLVGVTRQTIHRNMNNGFQEHMVMIVCEELNCTKDELM